MDDTWKAVSHGHYGVLFRFDAGCLKFFDDTPSVAMPHTLNNPQDLNADYLMIRFPVETLISWNAF